MTLYTLNNKDLREGTPPEGARVLVDAGEVARLAKTIVWCMQCRESPSWRAGDYCGFPTCNARRALIALTGENE